MATAASAGSRPSSASSRLACGSRLMPTPSGLISGAASKIRQGIPARCSLSPRVRPPMPAPTITTSMCPLALRRNAAIASAAYFMAYRCLYTASRAREKAPAGAYDGRRRRKQGVCMNKLNLTVATTDYDHFRDFRLGLVRAEGIDTTWLTLGHHEIFARFTFNREWDVTELSFAKFTAQVTRENPDIVGLPVYASRLFRFGSFYVNKKKGIRTAQDLKGKRIGSPEWAHTAAVYMRGWLQHEAGVRLKDVEWYQAGANEAGRIEKVELDLPKGVSLTRVSNKSLSEMVASGEIDCALIARPPTCFLQGHPDVVRLYPDFMEIEQEYYEKTKVWPIMHIIAVKREVLDAHPWVGRNLYNAFLESKKRSLERLLDPAVSRYPLPWLPTYGRKMRDMLGGDPFPFGIEPNRPTLETFLRYTYEQGIAHRHAKPEEIFQKGIMASVVV